MMNRKGIVPAKIISSIPIMFLIFIIITGYLITVGFAKVFRGESASVRLEKVNLDNLLIREVEINGEKLLVLDVIHQYWDEKVSLDDLEKLLEEIVKKDAKKGYCLAIAQGFNGGVPKIQNDVYDDFIMSYDVNLGNNPDWRYRELERYEKNKLFNQVGFINPKNNEKIYVNYYYGRCLNE